MQVIPRRYARYYLEHAPSLLVLIALNVVTTLVGLDFYVESMPDVHLFLWPLYTDSPVATLLMAASLLTLLSNLGRRLADAPHNRALAYLHTLAFVWLVKYGLWTAVAVNVGFGEYFPSLWAYWTIVLTHLGFAVQAFLIPHYGKTTRGALAFALGLALFDTVLDYGFDLHPPLRYDPGLFLPVATAGLSVLAVALAAWQFDWLPD